MDEETEALLEKSNLSEYVSVFKHNRIGISDIRCIPSEQLRVLIEPLGDRWRFLRAVESYSRDVTQSETSVKKIRTSLRDAVETPSKDSSIEYQNIGGNQKVDTRDEFETESDLISSDDENIQPKCSANSSVRVTYESPASRSTSSQQSTRRPLEESQSGHSSTCNSANSSSISESSRNTLKNADDLKEYLSWCADGRTVLKVFEVQKTLTDFARTTLTAVVLDKLLVDHNNKLRNKDIDAAANWICEIFPSESPLTYYIAPFSEGQKQSISKGKLPYRYRNRRRSLEKHAGLNAILGYSGCSSNYFCRMCRGHKRDLRECCEENNDLLRTRENYENDLLLNDFHLTGLKENCVFNKIPSFHVIENNAVDVMHDMLEGVCNYDMTVIIEYYFDVEMFSLESLNNYVQSFDYGYIEHGNKPPIITEAMLTKKKLHMQASEMMCFVRNFGLMVGDAIPEGDVVWKLYIILSQIMDIVMAPSYHVGTYQLLKILIGEHHALYIETCKKIDRYKNDRLKQKFHTVTHYPRILHLYGPVRNFWCMRFEGKHKVAKKVARMTGSRVNVIETIAKTQQLRLAYSLLNDLRVQDSLKLGPQATFQRSNVPDDFDETYVPYKWANYNGRLYKPEKCVVYVKTHKDLPFFGFVTGIFVRQSRLYFTFKNVPAVSFNEHKHSYIVNVTSLSSPNVECIAAADLFEFTPLHLRKIVDCHYVTLPYTL